MTRQRWTSEEDALLIQKFNEGSSALEALTEVSDELGRTVSSCRQRVSYLRHVANAEIKHFRTPKRIVTEYAKEIGNNLKENPGNISATIREMSSRTNVPVSILTSAWYRRKNELTDRSGRRMIFFSLMGDKSHPNTKVAHNSQGKRTKSLWKKLIEVLRK